MKINQNHISSFITFLQEEEKSPATVEKYLRDISAFCRWLQNGAADKESIIRYKAELIARYAPASVNSILSSLNSFFAFHQCHMLQVKMLKIPKKIFAESARALSKKEYDRLLDAAQKKNNRRLYLMMQTICASGIRVSELQFVTLEAVQARQATICCKGRMRMVLLPKALCRTLLTYAKARNIKKGPLFVTKTGRPLDRSTIWKMMKTLCEDAHVDKNKVFPHNLRHLFARTYYRLQKDIVRLADILGHSSINTTRIYTMETGEIHRQQLQSLGLLRQ